MKRATYRIVRFPKLDRYIGLAWNYDEAVLVSTRDHTTYTGARKELGATCEELGVELRWFDGEYDCIGDVLVPRADDVEVSS
jgi:hypothetical protein